jgi:hypothetical protein
VLTELSVCCHAYLSTASTGESEAGLRAGLSLFLLTQISP